MSGALALSALMPPLEPRLLDLIVALVLAGGILICLWYLYVKKV